VLLFTSPETFRVVVKKPALLLCWASKRPRAFGTKPSCAIALSTRARVSDLTALELFTTRETVIVETPAKRATSRKVAMKSNPPGIHSIQILRLNYATAKPPAIIGNRLPAKPGFKNYRRVFEASQIH
jgi:hypothetical protein